MSNPFKVGDQVFVESGMSKKLIGLTGEVMYIDGEFCEVALEGRKDYDRLHYLALRGYVALLAMCTKCNVVTINSELSEDGFCPKCDLKRGAETLECEYKPSCLPVTFPLHPNHTKPILPEDAQARKEIPLYSGLMQYFPRALCAVANQSYKGNQQHHPDKPLHWDRSKSSDEEDALLRHMIDGEWVQVAWRALARLEKELEK